MPQLMDPNFNRTVVLLCTHSEDEGAFGLVLNRPLVTHGRVVVNLESASLHREGARGVGGRAGRAASKLDSRGGAGSEDSEDVRDRRMPLPFDLSRSAAAPAGAGPAAAHATDGRLFGLGARPARVGAPGLGVAAERRRRDLVRTRRPGPRCGRQGDSPPGATPRRLQMSQRGALRSVADRA